VSSVKAEFYSGKTLERISKEVFSNNKKTGEVELTSKATGSYKIDGVKTATKKEFDEEVEKLTGDIQTFRVLSILKYFSEELKDDERRRLLLSNIDSVSISEIAQKRGYGAIKNEILDKGIDKYKSMLKSKKRGVKKEKESIIPLDPNIT